MRDNKKTTGIYLKYESVHRSVGVCFRPRAYKVKSLALLHMLIQRMKRQQPLLVCWICCVDDELSTLDLSGRAQVT